MATPTDLTTITEALDDLGALITHHGEILTHLEQREIPDIAGLARRLEDVADAVDRLRVTALPEHESRTPWWIYTGVVVVCLALGWGIAWATVRWLPGRILPPGFTRVEPGKQKGRF